MNAKAKGYILGAIAAATYGMNPLFALPLYSDGMTPDSVLFFRYLFAIPILGIMLKGSRHCVDIAFRLPDHGSYHHGCFFPRTDFPANDTVHRSRLGRHCAALQKRRRFDTESDRNNSCVRLGVVVCHISRRCQPSIDKKRADAESHFLRVALRRDTFRRAAALGRAYRNAVALVFMGLPDRACSFSNCHIVSMHHKRDTIHRLHADCHIGSIGTGDGHRVRSCHIRRSAHHPAMHWPCVDHHGSVARSGRRQRFAPSDALPAHVPSPSPQTPPLTAGIAAKQTP